MYWQDRWVFRDSIEYEIKYAGNYGAKGESRAKKQKATPEQIKKQNQLNKEKRMRRLIKANFSKGDMWVTLKYKKGERPDIYSVKTDLKKFIDAMRRRYKKAGCEFKFIYRLEIGKQGGVHIHMIVPRIRGADLDIQDVWQQGRVNFESLDDGDYKELASYITKPPDESVDKQLSLFPLEVRREFVKYSSSRNLIRPVPERKEFKKRTVRKILREGIQPTKGYYIDKSSIVTGINQYTGMSYIHYTERKLINDG